MGVKDMTYGPWIWGVDYVPHINYFQWRIHHDGPQSLGHWRTYQWLWWLIQLCPVQIISRLMWCHKLFLLILILES